MKKVETLLKEYVTKLSDDNLKYLDARFGQRLCGDLAEALALMSQTHDIDRWLSSAKGANEFYDMLDLAAKYVEREYNKRAQQYEESKR